MTHPAPETRPSRWVIVGGNGFVGTNLIHALAADQGDVVVIGRNKPRWPVVRDGVRYVEQDYRETDALRPHLTPGAVVVHMANMSYPGKAETMIGSDLMDNVVGTVRLARAAADAGVASLVFLSTGGAIYGDQEAHALIPETALPRPVSAYGALKLTIEHYLYLMHRLSGLPVTSLRISNAYGPWHRGTGQGAINVFLRHLHAGEPIDLWGDGSQVRDYVHVADVCKAIRIVGMNHRQGFESFNVGTGTGMSLMDVLRACERVSEKRAVIHSLPERRVDVHRNVLDISAIRIRYGWEPTITVDEGLRNVWSWTESAFRSERYGS